MKNRRIVAGAALAVGLSLGALAGAGPANAAPIGAGAASPQVVGQIEMNLFATKEECISRYYQLKEYDAIIDSPCTWSEIYYKWYILYRLT